MKPPGAPRIDPGRDANGIADEGGDDGLADGAETSGQGAVASTAGSGSVGPKLDKVQDRVNRTRRGHAVECEGQVDRDGDLPHAGRRTGTPLRNESFSESLPAPDRHLPAQKFPLLSKQPSRGSLSLLSGHRFPVQAPTDFPIC